MKIVFKILLIIFVPSLFFAQKNENWSVANMPVELALGAHEVVRYSDQQFEVKSLKEGRFYSKKVITVMNEESDANVLYVSYDADSKLKNFEAYILDAKGELIRKIDKDEIKDYPAVDGYSLYQDDRIQFVEINHSNYPYTIVWEYEKTMEGIDFVMYPDWSIQAYNQGVEKSVFMLSVPEEVTPHFEWHNIELAADKSEEGKNTLYRWSVENLRPLSPESYGPPSIKVLPRLYISPSAFEAGNVQGSMSSWQNFGAFIYQLFKGRDELPNEVTADVRNLVAGLTDTRQKVEVLYDYLQKNMRYVSVQLGIGGWQPFDAAYVAKNNYGDCKALSNFMMALLKKAGIQSYPVLIQSGGIDYPIHKGFTYPRFNHVILYVPEIDYWLECTSNDYPANYIGSSNMNRTVLLITEEGGQLKRTPSIEPKEHQEVIKAKVVVEATGTAKIDYKSELTGSRHEFFRNAAIHYTEKERREWLQEHVPLVVREIHKLEMRSADEKPVAELNYSVQVAKYASGAGKRLFVPLNIVSVYGGSPKKQEQRRFPIYHGKAYSEVLDIELELPPGYEVEALPYPEEVLESEFATYKLQVKQEGSKILLRREIEWRPAVMPAADYDQFRKFYRDMSRREKAKLVLVEKKT